MIFTTLLLSSSVHCGRCLVHHSVLELSPVGNYHWMSRYWAVTVHWVGRNLSLPLVLIRIDVTHFHLKHPFIMPSFDFCYLAHWSFVCSDLRYLFVSFLTRYTSPFSCGGQIRMSVLMLSSMRPNLTEGSILIMKICTSKIHCGPGEPDFLQIWDGIPCVL